MRGSGMEPQLSLRLDEASRPDGCRNDTYYSESNRAGWAESRRRWSGSRRGNTAGGTHGVVGRRDGIRRRSGVLVRRRRGSRGRGARPRARLPPAARRACRD